jgi:hypothetical protein
MFSKEKSQARSSDDDPLARLLVHLPAARIPRMRVLLVAVDRVLQDCEHEETLALEPALAPERREELGRQENVRLEEARQPVVSGRKASLTFCNHLPPLFCGRSPLETARSHAYHGRKLQKNRSRDENLAPGN